MLAPTTRSRGIVPPSQVQPLTRTLCRFPANASNSGDMAIEMRRVQPPLQLSSKQWYWQDERRVVLDWTTNMVTCSVVARSSACPVGPELHTRHCEPCPCNMSYALEGPQISLYARSICRRIVQRHSCAFQQAVVIGLGTGFISSCIVHHCPQVKLVTVDIDPTVLWAARHYFGWNAGRGAVSMLGAEEWFRQSAARGDRRDLVVIDCAWRHTVPPGCRSVELLAHVRAVLVKQGPTMVSVNIGFGEGPKARIYEPAVGDTTMEGWFKHAFASLPHLSISREGQWLHFETRP